MPNYKILVQYVGTKYKGWQIQKSTEETIQGKLNAVISRMVGYPVEVIGSGRTDAGVHAIGQVANFHIKSHVKDKKGFIDEINQYLPTDIAVIKMQDVDERFHSRFSAKSKTYRYRIYKDRIPDVFSRKFVYFYTDKELDVEKMKKAAALMTGEHDFKCFCGNPHMKKPTVRNVMKIDIEESDKEITIDFTGNGFLQNMVRIMAGTLIEVGNGTRGVGSIAPMIKSLDREKAGFTAPPQGLCLMKVDY